MPHLSLALLGGFEVTIDGEPITAFDTNKVRGLLAFLAVESARPYRRTELAAMLWPDLPEKKAAHNFSQTLLRLRRALRDDQSAPQPFLLISSQEVQFNPRSNYQLDVARFRELLQAQRQHYHSHPQTCQLCIQWLQQAATLYRGDLLAGLLVRDSVGFEEWRLVLQEMLHAQALEALAQLSAHYEQLGAYEQVQDYARRQVAMEPWSEQAHLQLMRALALSGQSAAALEQYQTYCQILDTELGLAPSAEATVLYQKILSGELVKQEETQTGPHKTDEPVWVSGQGEVRQVTAMVCGPADVTTYDDPEALHEQLAVCTLHCEHILSRFGGYRAQRHGTECVVYFGYPQAYEDAARRAVRAALEITTALKNNDDVRIGIHTGEIVVGERRGPGWQNRDLLGNVPNVARLCRNLAQPDSILITESTHHLVQDWFDCQILGAHTGATLPRPIELYHVQRENSTQKNRFNRLRQAQHLTIFVGREPEVKQLRAFQDKAWQGHGQVILLNGEPGIGKSRLVWELKRQVLAHVDEPIAEPVLPAQVQPALWLESHCTPYFQNTNLHPLINLLEQLLGFAANDTPETRRDKLIHTLTQTDLAHPAAVWLLSLLLGLPTDSPAPQTITPEQQERMREVFVALLQKQAARRPMVLVIEDLHWSDPTTIDWLDRSFNSLAAIPCLLLLTFRPQFKSPWLPRAHVHPLNLGRLNPAQAEQIVANLVVNRALPETTRCRIVAQTDGIPLFVEELTKTLLEEADDLAGAGVEAKEQSKIPATLRDAMMARLDHLGAAKETAQWAAALGREFLYPVLHAVTGFDEKRLQRDLTRLSEAELVFRPDQPAHLQYMFKHSLIQEAAYASLPKRIRRRYHQQIAETLEAHFPQTIETMPEILAQHYMQAGSNRQAVDYWLLAGERATTQGATLEAQTFFDRAIKLIEPANSNQRWRALCGRETVLSLREERPAQQEDINALLELAEVLDDDTRRAQAFMRQTQYGLRLKDFQLMLRAVEAALSAATRAGNRTLEVQALSSKVTALAYIGTWAAAQEAVDKALERLPAVADNVIRAYALGDMAFYYSRVGNSSRALLLMQQGAEAARRAGNRHKESRLDVNIGFVNIQLGRYTAARAAFENGLALAEAIGDRALQNSHRYNLSYVYWCEGNRELARTVGEQALQEFRTTVHNTLGHASCLTYLGIYLEEAGDLDTAAAYLAQANALHASIGVNSYRMETQAVTARVALAQGQKKQAQNLALEVWAYLSEQGVEGMDFPSTVYGCVADVFNAVTMPATRPSASEVIEAGYRELMQSADKISNPEWRQSFLENVAGNRAIVKRWEQLKNNLLHVKG
ncbi:MAG: hypothetical protein FOGNACKC_00559 [Anaerolineae bacterium]|nr:hypothetical protein [Anaerolineae bacterium]